MNAILYSSNPKQTARVLNKEQTIIILKNIPAEWKEWLKDQSKPFPKKELYLYCTKGKELNFNAYENQWEYNHPLDKKLLNPSIHNVNGKVVAKCVVEKIEELKWLNTLHCYNAPSRYGSVENMPHCLTKEQINAYGKNKTLYALHLTALEIFDKPKELGEFGGLYKVGYNEAMDYWEWARSDGTEKASLIPCPESAYRIKHAPQSWCYIESEEK